MMEWIPLTSSNQIDEIVARSNQTPVVIYKHSTRCGTSQLVFQRLERHRKGNEAWAAPAYFLDVIAHRDVSNAVADTFDVAHESPQLLLISGGKSIFDASHYAIDFTTVMDVAKSG